MVGRLQGVGMIHLLSRAPKNCEVCATYERGLGVDYSITIIRHPRNRADSCSALAIWGMFVLDKAAVAVEGF